MPIKVLFLLKYREVTDTRFDPATGTYVTTSYSKQGLSSGLLNSARMVGEMLNEYGLNGEACEAKLVQVVDNNCIDREVFAFKPDVCIIEAFWVVPEKFDILTKLHPKVKWLIRNHSNIPFLAQEGQTLNWIPQYVRKKNVYVATNTKPSLGDLKELVALSHDPEDHEHIRSKVKYFPNYYMTDMKPTWNQRPESDNIHVGCFGAIRPLKNQLEQAFAAIRYGRKHGKYVYFHINGGRAESGGLPILHNLRSLFRGAKQAELVEHTWMPHSEFVKLIGEMDLSMQVSFSETFNIVTADAAQQGVPVVGSSDIMWLPQRYWAEPTNSENMVEVMEVALADAHDGRHNTNQHSLAIYNENSKFDISNTILDVISHQDHAI